MDNTQPTSSVTLGYTIKQQRSQKTYNTLVATGYKLLETRAFESISILEIVKEAGYSVGAFYSRFHSKDEYFEAMVQFHLDYRLNINKELIDSGKPDKIVKELIISLVNYYWDYRNFWCAVLVRNGRDGNFWGPISKQGDSTAQYFIGYINKLRPCPLTTEQEENVAFAFQIIRGVINNAILKRPGPIFMPEAEFIEHVTRSFELVSDYKGLISSK